MTPDQTTLALYTCRTCQVELEYQGVGRPPVFCDDHRPGSFPTPKNPVRVRQQVNGGVSGRPGVLLDVPTTHGRARATDPSTSLDAARVRRADLEHKILTAFVEHGPMTDDELAACIDRYAPTVKSARSRFALTDREDGPLIEETGELRESNHGRSMKVWRLTPAGVARAQHT